MTTPSKSIGLIGLGLIGHPLAVNLMADGYTVWGYRRSSMERFVEAGGVGASAPREIAENADVVFTCLPSADALHEVISGPDGLLAAGRRDLLVIELSTFPIPVKEQARAALREAGGDMLDAPISATPKMVEGRQATVFLSGEPDACERAAPSLAALGSLTERVGAFGTGSALKFLANTLIAIHTVAAAEVMSLAAAAGIDADLVVRSISPSAASSGMFTIRAPMMAERRSRPVFATIDTLVKDTSAIRDFAAGAGAYAPLLDAAAALFRRAADLGFGGEDIAVMASVIDSERAERDGHDAPGA